MSVNQRGQRRPPFVETIFGGTASGYLPCPGTAVGDIVENVRLITTMASASSSFETTITVAGEIKQTSGSNLSANEYDVIISPGS